ncbi:2-dehydro-3-deoxyphosphooctonate aldolase [Flavobacterium rhizosphaerae]|uniref:2-dehydro-3-deoxyphosphooctonate aldolase n=1 Tax=Flavobacterium rhizosphaerae TaxID=3163298 RepID=A0ABW8YWW0_9FLAO
MKNLFLSLLIVTAVSCVSTRNTIKNINDSAQMPPLTPERNYVITKISSQMKYGYDEDYPVNLGFLPLGTADISVKRYFNSLSGPNGETLSYKKLESCCPFPTEKFNAGAGLLDVYEVTWEGLKEPKHIYINIYEKGAIIAPKGFGIRKVL